MALTPRFRRLACLIAIALAGWARPARGHAQHTRAPQLTAVDSARADSLRTDERFPRGAGVGGILGAAAGALLATNLHDSFVDRCQRDTRSGCDGDLLVFLPPWSDTGPRSGPSP